MHEKTCRRKYHMPSLVDGNVNPMRCRNYQASLMTVFVVMWGETDRYSAIPLQCGVIRDVIVITGIIDSNDSDHCQTFIEFNYIKQNYLIVIHKFEFRHISESKLNDFTFKLSQINWENLISTSNADHRTISCEKVLNDMFCCCFPIKIKQMSKKRFLNMYS